MEELKRIHSENIFFQEHDHAVARWYPAAPPVDQYANFQGYPVDQYGNYCPLRWYPVNQYENYDAHGDGFYDDHGAFYYYLDTFSQWSAEDEDVKHYFNPTFYRIMMQGMGTS